MACPDDPEAERPRNYIESISGDASWDNHGIVIKWTEPIVPGSIRLSLNEPVRLRLCVETKNDLQVPPEDLTAWCWTPIITDVCITFVQWRSRGRWGKGGGTRRGWSTCFFFPLFEGGQHCLKGATNSDTARAVKVYATDPSFLR